jgi:hypothetical protein
LTAVFAQFALHGLESQCILSSGIAVAGPKIRGSLCPEIPLVVLQSSHLRNQPFAQSGMRG